MGPIVVLVVVAVSAVLAVLVLRWGDRRMARQQAEAEARRQSANRRRASDNPAPSLSKQAP